jgi:hypothetical protein
LRENIMNGRIALEEQWEPADFDVTAVPTSNLVLDA